MVVRDADAVAGLFVDALQHWLNAEQHMHVVVDPSDEDRRPSQVLLTGLRLMCKCVLLLSGWKEDGMGLPCKNTCDIQILPDWVPRIRGT